MLRSIFSEWGIYTITELGFLSVNETNRPPRIYQTYSSSRRQLKFSLIISVLAADYALLAALYALVIYVGRVFQRGKVAKGALAGGESM